MDNREGAAADSDDDGLNDDLEATIGTDPDQAQVLTQNRVAVALSKLPEEARRQGVSTRKKSPSILLCVNLVSPDGRFDQLFHESYDGLIEKAGLRKRRIFHIDNPLLSPQTPLSNKAYWYNPY